MPHRGTSPVRRRVLVAVFISLLLGLAPIRPGIGQESPPAAEAEAPSPPPAADSDDPNRPEPTPDNAPNDAENKDAENKDAENKEGENENKDSSAEPVAVLPGHSYHGEVFNEGPRQEAHLLPGMGNISFPITVRCETAQRFFNQGIAQLHGFWYFESERSFRQVAALDPQCAMAYWGMALANMGNEKRSKGFIEQAVKRQAEISEREKRYIDALNKYLQAGNDKKKERAEAYADALERITYEYPEDIEAQALLVLQIWNNRNAGIKIQSHQAVDSLMDRVFATTALHPAHHYRIHLWDYQRPEKSLAAAAACGPSLPGVAHMWHMPGHIYSRLKRYHDAVYQQEASARVDHAHMMRYRVMPDQIHNFAHNNEWLIRNLNHVGRVRDAVDLAKNMIELPRHPKYNTPSRGGCSAAYGRERLLDTLVAYELWDELIALADTPYLEPTDIERELADVQGQRDKAAVDAAEKAKSENKDEKETEKAVEAAKKGFDSRLRELEQALAEISAHAAFVEGRHADAHEALKKAGDIDRLFQAEVQLLAGETDEALKAAREQVNRRANEVQPLARLVELLVRAEKHDDAVKEFERLRAISGDIDLASPVFTRLTPLAQKLGLNDDWRVAQPEAADIGDRPALDSLGPFRWSPSPAPDWTLPDVDGQPQTLKQHLGRPVVVIFYLGYGCLHCAEQLKAFAPHTEEFQAANIELVAISSDDPHGLRNSVENYKDGEFPFPLTSDPELRAFRDYRAYDDFEKVPLHGTFLIDEQGQVIWQDISYEPFMDAQFVLKEAQRQRQLRNPAPQTPAQ
jgi:peroxiredoxin